MRGSFKLVGHRHLHIASAILLLALFPTSSTHADGPATHLVQSNGSYVVRGDTTTTTPVSGKGSSLGEFSAPVIVGIVGGVGFLILIIVLSFKYCGKRRSSKRAMSATALTDALIEQFASVRVGGAAYAPSGGTSGDDNMIDTEAGSVGSWDGRDTVISVKDGVYSNIFGKRQTVNPPSDVGTSSMVTVARTEDPNLSRDVAIPPLPPRPNTAPEEQLPTRPRTRHPPAYARADPDVPESVLDELDPEVQHILRTGRPPETGFHLESA